MDQSEIELQLFHSVLNHSLDAIVVVNGQGTIRYWSCSATRIFCKSADEMLGRSFWELVPQEQVTPTEKIWQRISLLTDQGRTLPQPISFEFVRGDGLKVWVSMTLNLAKIDGEPWVIAICRDVTAQHRRESRLITEARSDSLSGLLNRGEFQRRLEANIGKPLGLAILDIDDFKQINDQFGHLAGDNVIRKFAQLLTRWFPKAVCIARLGGDEFGVLVEINERCDTDTDSSGEPNIGCAQKQLQKLQAECGKADWNLASTTEDVEPQKASVPIEDFEYPAKLARELTVTFSGGFAVIGQQVTTPRELLQTADERLYRAKAAGKNQIVYA